MAKETVDLVAGLYRRVYAGFITGKRINSVSMDCEAFFWRINAVADDFGNYHGDPALIRSGTQGRRDFTVKVVERWVDELVSAKLVERYESGGEAYIHVLDFDVKQPAGRNGRRIKRFPLAPGQKDEPGGIQGNPGETSASESDTHSHSHSQSDARGGIEDRASTKRRATLDAARRKRHEQREQSANGSE